MRIDPKDRLKAGLDVKYTNLNADDEDGFVYPDPSGDWMLFVPNEDGYVSVGTFPAEEVFDLDWKQYRYMMIREIEERPIMEAMDFLCCLYMDTRNENWTLMGSLIANDAECIRWAIDYLYFLKWNGCDRSPLDFSDLTYIFLNPDRTIELLEEKRAYYLADQLRRLSRYYNTMTVKYNSHLKKVVA